MDLRQTPSYQEISDLIRSSASLSEEGELTAYTRHLALRLIAQVPEAARLWQRLHEDPGDRPSALELSQLAYSAGHPGAFPEAYATARWLIERIPELRERDRQLRRMQRDVCFACHEAEAVAAHRQVDEMLRNLEQSPGSFRVQDHLPDFRPQPQWILDVCVARWMRAQGSEAQLLARLKTLLEEHFAAKRRRAR